jgi:hypothetical protein
MPAVGPYSIEPRPPFPVTCRSVDDFAAVQPKALAATDQSIMVPQPSEHYARSFVDGFRRRSVWIAWLLPKPKVLELPGHCGF